MSNFEFYVWYRLFQIVHREWNIRKDITLNDILMKFCPNKSKMILKIDSFLSNDESCEIVEDCEMMEDCEKRKKNILEESRCHYLL